MIQQTIMNINHLISFYFIDENALILEQEEQTA